MRSLSSVHLAVALVLAPLALGCSSRKPADPIAELRGLRDQMCGCTDAACGDKVQGQVQAWSTRNDKAEGSSPAVQAMIARIALCHDNAGGDPLAREILTVLEGYRGRACACKDADCATAVQLEQNKWLLDNQAKYAPVKSTPAQEKESGRLANETDHCVRKLAKPASVPAVGKPAVKLPETAGSGSAPPVAPPPTAP